MVEYRKISIKKELADVVEEFIDRNPHFGFRSIAEFVEDVLRKRAESLGIIVALMPRFMHHNVHDDHVTIIDNQLHREVEVYFQDKPFCEFCEEHNCEHISFALTIPKVVKALKERGWKMRNGVSDYPNPKVPKKGIESKGKE